MPGEVRPSLDWESERTSPTSAKPKRAKKTGQQRGDALPRMDSSEVVSKVAGLSRAHAHSQGLPISNSPSMVSPPPRPRSVSGFHPLVASPAMQQQKISSTLEPQSGVLDVWPANSNSSNMGQWHLPRSFSPPVTKQRTANGGGGMHKVVAKPKFLIDIERYLSTELGMLGPDGKRPGSSSRLSVFSYCFDRFIDNFLTYKGVLHQIKSEYETCIRQRDVEIQNLQPVLAKAESADARMEKVLQKLDAEHKVVVAQMRQELEDEKDKVYLFEKSQRELQEKNRSLEVQNLRMRNELKEATDSNVTLSKVANNFKHQLEDAQKHIESVKEIKVLNEHLKKEIQKRKQEIEGMVPMHEFNRVSDELEEGMRRVEQTNKDYEKLLRQMRDQAKKTRIVEAENEKLRKQADGLTPRPQWEGVFKAVKTIDNVDVEAYIDEKVNQKGQSATVFDVTKEEEEEMRAFKLNEDGSTRELIAMLAEKYRRSSEQLLKTRAKLRLTEKRLASFMPTAQRMQDVSKEAAPREATFKAIGTGPEVPKFLRWNGRVRNRNMGKAEVEKLIRDVWREKMKLDKAKGDREPLQEYVYIYLLKKFGMQGVIAEWGYNIMDALRRFSFDADCELFLEILEGNISEDAYYEQLKLVEKVIALGKKIETAGGDIRHAGRVPKSEFLSQLRKMLSYKTDEDFDVLVSCINQDMPGDHLYPERLFDEDREGNQKLFAEALRDQQLDEFMQYHHMLEVKLKDAADESGNINGGGVRDVIKSVAPPFGRGSKECLSDLCKGFGFQAQHHVEQLVEDTQIAVELFMQVRIKHSNMCEKEIGCVTHVCVCVCVRRCDIE